MLNFLVIKLLLCLSTWFIAEYVLVHDVVQIHSKSGKTLFLAIINQIPTSDWLAHKKSHVQNVVWPNTVGAVTAVVTTAVLHYIFVTYLQLGTLWVTSFVIYWFTGWLMELLRHLDLLIWFIDDSGSAIAETVALFVLFLVVLFYVLCSRIYKATWPGEYTINLLIDWLVF